VTDPTVTTLAVLTCLALALRLPVRPTLIWTVTAVLAILAAGLIALAVAHPAFGFDYRIFYGVGEDVWAGRNPYAPETFGDHPFLNPPTALPLFALFAALPLGTGSLLWAGANVLACVALVPLARGIGRGQGPGAGSGPGVSDATVVAGLTAVLLVSDAALVNLVLGQLAVLAALALLLALRDQALGRPGRAGVWLAVATVKVATLLPFLLLFLRKSDRLTWLTLAACVAGLCLLAAPPPADLPARLSGQLERIAELAAPGRVNDYSFQGTQHLNMMGFEHALYRLGLRDRRLIRAEQFLALAALGAWVARAVLGPRRLPRPAACSLVALFSAVFLYHRLYDAVILVLPLVYCTEQARQARGQTRWLFAGGALGSLTVLFLSRGFLAAAFEFSEGKGLLGSLVQATVLPCATWIIVLTMFCLVAASRRADPGSGGPLPGTAVIVSG
jgi:hypothetical protein